MLETIGDKTAAGWWRGKVYIFIGWRSELKSVLRAK